MRLTGTVEGVTEFDRTFTRFTSQILGDFRPIWPGVVTELRNIMREQFAAQGAGKTGQWAQLSPRYRAWKEKHFPGRPILQREQRLVASLTQSTSNTILVQGRDELIFGTRRRGAKFHQTGTRRMPRRAVFDLSEQQAARLTRVVHRRLLSVGASNGIPVVSSTI